MARPGFSKAVVLQVVPGEKPLTEIERNAPIHFGVDWIPKQSWTDLLSWKVSPISVKLGFPLKVAPCADAFADGPIDPGFNNRIAPLFVNSDINDPNFGYVNADPIPLWGDCLVMRCNKEDLELNQLMILSQYINETMGEAASYEYPTMPKEVQDSIKAEVSKKLNPETFRAYFEERCDQTDASGGKEDTEKASSNKCAACGGEGKDGQELRVCARCKEARYCDRSCQKLHWKKHKKACQAAVVSQTRAA